jgi:GR25 family glycosyltransferase involved in LPS biosynthesis
VVKLETRNLRVHLSKKKIAIGRGRHVSRLCSTFYGAACYVITSDAARRLLHVTENCVDPVDVVLCDTRHPVASTLSVYQMSPAPAVQGHLANWKKATGTWTQSSIDFRWKLEKPAAIRRETSAQRLNRRFKEEVRAFFRGTRYVVIPHG